MNQYIGNAAQMRGAEKYILQDGKGNGMHFIYVRNGLGLEAWISMDRCADVSRVTFKGDNMGYFAPCGYVAPQYYDGVGEGFLKSFTAGFFTTCGLTAVGSPCNDEGEELPLHGTISNTPAELTLLEENDDALNIHVVVHDAMLGGHKLKLERRYRFSYRSNQFTVEDFVKNEGDTPCPYMILYHCNMGYPLLTENSEIKIPYESMTSRNEHAEECKDLALQVEKPQTGYEECCYYFDLKEKDNRAHVGIFNNEIQKGLVMSFDKEQLPCFTEWKNMAPTDYVLGLEPGNCTPDGRDVLRKNNTLQFLQPEEIGATGVKFYFTRNKESWDNRF